MSELRSGAPFIAGTAHYSPPGRELNIQDDMWSLGISMLELINNQNPFAAFESSTVTFEIYQWIPEVPTMISPDLQELLLNL